MRNALRVLVVLGVALIAMLVDEALPIAAIEFGQLPFVVSLWLGLVMVGVGGLGMFWNYIRRFGA